jgi:hypothetical protein
MDVVVTTCIGSGNKFLEGLKFEACLIDEGSTVVEPTALLPLCSFGCSRVAIVGDDKQLPPFVNSSFGNSLGVSLFERLLSVYGCIQLDTQRRMHSSIAEFPMRYWYGLAAQKLTGSGCPMLDKRKLRRKRERREEKVRERREKREERRREKLMEREQRIQERKKIMQLTAGAVASAIGEENVTSERNGGNSRLLPEIDIENSNENDSENDDDDDENNDDDAENNDDNDSDLNENDNGTANDTFVDDSLLVKNGIPDHELPIIPGFPWPMENQRVVI